MSDDIFQCVDPNGVPFSKTNNFVDKAWAMKKIAALEEEIARLRECIRFFASVIKSGEAWSETCQQKYAAAIREGGKDE